MGLHMIGRRRDGKTQATKPAGDPFAPVEFVTGALLAITLGGMLFFAVLAGVQVATSGQTSFSFAGIGSDSTCVTVPSSSPGIGPFDASGNGYQRTEGISRFRSSEAHYRADSWFICLKQPTSGQYWAARVEPVGQFVFGLGALVLIRRFIRTARRCGLFTQPTASAARHLGWFLLLFAVLLPFAAAAGEGVVVAQAVNGADWYDLLWGPDLSLVLVITALGVLTMARVLARAVPLQEEVDATV